LLIVIAKASQMGNWIAFLWSVRMEFKEEKVAKISQSQTFQKPSRRSAPSDNAPPAFTSSESLLFPASNTRGCSIMIGTILSFSVWQFQLFANILQPELAEKVGVYCEEHSSPLTQEIELHKKFTRENFPDNEKMISSLEVSSHTIRY
jgi:hypothetical protein